MTDTVLNGNLPAEETEELVDYEEEAEDQAGQAKAGEAPAKKGYVGIHSTGFKDFLLKPELLRAIVDCGFEHPSEGQRWGSMQQLLPYGPALCQPAARHLTALCCLRARSAARVHPASHPGHGRAVPGQVRDGQDSRVRALRAATVGTGGKRGGSPHHLPHARAGVSGTAGSFRLSAYARVFAGLGLL